MMNIDEIRPNQFEAVKSVMEGLALELWGLLLFEFCQYAPLTDLDDIQASYIDNDDTFPVLLDGEWVIRTGGIQTAGVKSRVLKRLRLLKTTPGQGWGKSLPQHLIDHAKDRECRQVRLTIAKTQLQEPAIRINRKVGFLPVDQIIAEKGVGLLMQMER